MMVLDIEKDDTIYVRKMHDGWESSAKTRGKMIILSQLDSRETAIKSMTFLLWAMITFGPTRYGEEMEKVAGAPEGVEYPVIEK